MCGTWVSSGCGDLRMVDESISGKTGRQRCLIWHILRNWLLFDTFGTFLLDPHSCLPVFWSVSELYLLFGKEGAAVGLTHILAEQG